MDSTEGQPCTCGPHEYCTRPCEAPGQEALPPFLAALADRLMQVKRVTKSVPVPSLGRVVIYRTYVHGPDPSVYPAIVMDVLHPDRPYSDVKLWVMRDSGPMVLWAAYSEHGHGWSWPPFVPPATVDVYE